MPPETPYQQSRRRIETQQALMEHQQKQIKPQFVDQYGQTIAPPKPGRPNPQAQQGIPPIPPGFVQPAGLSPGSYVRQGTYLPASAWRGPDESAADIGPYEDPRMGGGPQLNPIISAILGMR